MGRKRDIIFDAECQHVPRLCDGDQAGFLPLGVLGGFGKIVPDGTGPAEAIRTQYGHSVLAKPP